MDSPPSKRMIQPAIRRGLLGCAAAIALAGGQVCYWMTMHSRVTILASHHRDLCQDADQLQQQVRTLDGQKELLQKNGKTLRWIKAKRLLSPPLVQDLEGHLKQLARRRALHVETIQIKAQSPGLDHGRLCFDVCVTGSCTPDIPLYLWIMDGEKKGWGLLSTTHLHITRLRYQEPLSPVTFEWHGVLQFFSDFPRLGRVFPPDPPQGQR